MTQEQDNTKQGRRSLDMPLAQACVRSLANDASADADSMCPAGAELPADNSQLIAHRGQLDAYALRHLHHDAHVHAQLAPTDAVERLLFDALEHARFESVGADQYSGLQKNLDARVVPLVTGAGESMALALSSDTSRLQLAAFILGEKTLRSCAFKPSSMHTIIEKSAEFAALHKAWSSELAELVQCRDDQQAFALQTRLMVKQWRSGESAMAHDSDALEGDADDERADDSEHSSDEAVADDDAIDDPSVIEDSSSDTPDEGEESAPADAEGESQPSDATATPLMDEAPMGGSDPRFSVQKADLPYHAFSTQFDEVCLPAEFADQQALAGYRDQLDQHIDVHARLVRRLATRLQRALLARQRRQWQFDLEEGQLDTARLSRIISDPLVPLSFKSESEAPTKDTAITLLIDNSRSMLGRPIMIAAAATDILARTLERCGVSVEILGFTTAHLHGGRSTQEWERAGKPDNPGRLNDLRHIVYKSADTPYRSARKHLGLMLDKELLKQNIDGEALAWANQRLLKRPEKRKILMMISDGAPVETSTLSANADDYLVRHLHATIEQIERAGAVELMAIGIGHDVSAFYSHALSVFDVRQLGPAMLNELESLLRKAA